MREFHSVVNNTGTKHDVVSVAKHQQSVLFLMSGFRFESHPSLECGMKLILLIDSFTLLDWC